MPTSCLSSRLDRPRPGQKTIFGAQPFGPLLERRERSPLGEIMAVIYERPVILNSASGMDALGVLGGRLLYRVEATVTPPGAAR
jgi:hypothetical protein